MAGVPQLPASMRLDTTLFCGPNWPYGLATKCLQGMSGSSPCFSLQTSAPSKMCNSEQPKAGILIVDDNPAILLTLRNILKDSDHRVEEATTVIDAVDLLFGQEFIVAIIGVHGREFSDCLAEKMTCRINDCCTPIIIYSEDDDPAITMEQAYSLGAVDYLVTPLSAGLVRSKVNAFADLYSRTNLRCRQVEQDFQNKRRSVESRLQSSEQEVRDFFDNATVGLHIVGHDGIILNANKAELQLLGYEPEEYIGRPISDFHVDEATIDDILQRLGSGQSISEYPARLRCKDGSIKEVLIDSSAKFEEGRFVHTRCFTRDITDRNRALVALQKSETRWRTMTEVLPNLVWTELLTGECDWLSIQWEQYTGIPASDLLGMQRQEKVIHPDDVQRTLECMRAAGEGRAAYELEHRIRRHDGLYRWFKTRGTPIRDEKNDIVYWFGTCTDIEDSKQLESDLIEADRRKDEFLATLAHELRNPLAPVRTSLNILRVPGVDAETIEHSYQMIERQVEHLVRLVDDLLDVSRVMRGKIKLKKEIVDFRSIVHRSIECVSPMMESLSQQLSVCMPKDPLIVDADPVRLTQVAVNLLNNASKYTNSQGDIQVSVTRAGNDAALTVRDSGVGIPAEMLTKIFDLFVQVDSSGTGQQSGLGVGLTLARNLVSLHGGTIVAMSDGKGNGSEFTVHLPLAPVPSQQVSEARSDHKPRIHSRSPARVLVVDDNRDAAFSLSILLRLQGHTVEVADNGLTALQLLESYQPHIAFVDIRMPHLNGFELARHIRQKSELAKMTLVAITGCGSSLDCREALESGFDFHLVKPATLEEVMQLLDDLPHQRTIKKTRLTFN